MITPPTRPPGYNPVDVTHQVQQNAAAARTSVPVAVTAVVQGEQAEPPDSKEQGEAGQDQERPGPPPSGARGRVLDIKA